MEVYPVGFLLALRFGVINCSTLSNDVITWPREYHFKAESQDFETTLKSSMEIWYSTRFNRSCIENHRIKKTYYAPDTFPHMIQLISNKNSESEIACIQDSFADAYTSALNFLPNASTFENSGKSTYFKDRRVNIWRAEKNVLDDWWSKEVLYLLKTVEGVHLPVWYEYKLYNALNGSVLKHHTSTYYDFKNNITEQDVTLSNASNCKYISDYMNGQKDTYTLLHPDVPSDLNSAFSRYKSIHQKKYHGKEQVIRKHIFEKNWRMIIDHNQKNLTYKLSINQFADKTKEELMFRNAGYPFEHPGLLARPFPHTLEEVQELVKQLPVNFDLRMEGVIGAVKAQGNCSSCWAFATTAAVEGVIARGLAGSRLLDLSEQSLIDCSWRTENGNFGCHGGWVGPAMDYVTRNGIPLESDYTYIKADGICRIKEMSNAVHKIQGYVLVTPAQPDAMKVAIYKYGPVAVTMRAEGMEFFLYDSGVFRSKRPYSSCSNFQINHAVALVGYGVRDGEEYWIAKNSYGEEWGQGGYILLAAAEHNCFLTLDEPYYPVW